jgi:hypothetical protein
LAFNGSGVHNRVHDWTQDLAGNIPVTASRMDAEHDDISSSLSSTICRDGQSTTTARIPFASGVSAAAGTAAAVAYAQTNDTNTGLYFPGTDQWGLVAGGTAVISGTSSGVAVTGTFSASGAAMLSGSLALAGDLSINTNKFTVAAASGNTLIAGTAGITGDVAVNTNKFTVAAASGNTAIAGTLGVTGDVAVNTNKFTVSTSSGNTAVAGTLGVTGDLAVNTNKFIVTAATGNIAVAGTLAVTGASTLTGALSANNATGVTARNTLKAAVTFTTDGSSNITVVGTAFNISGIAALTVASQNGFRGTFTNNMSGANYSVYIRANKDSDVTELTGAACRNQDKTTSTFDFVITTEGTASTRSNLTVDIFVFENA